MTINVKIMPSCRKRSTRPSKSGVAVLAYDGVCTFELGIAIEVFGLVGMGPDWYRVVVCADRPGQPVLANGGVKIVADAGLDALDGAGTIILPGWQYIDAAPPPALLERLRRAYSNGSRVASICSGVFILAAAGLLDGHRAAVHWAQAEVLARMYPQIDVDPNVLYVDEGNVLTSAGRAAGLDLCLHMVRNDHGTEVANEVARRLVIAPHRDGGQAQFIPRPVSVENDPLSDVFGWALGHLDRDLSIAELADKAKMSRRTFIRRFEQATGTSPGEWVLQARITEARRLLETTVLPIEQIATATGFGSADTLRHHFRTRLYTSPARYRSSFAAQN
jgi:AraC family transcriptional regulator, transcriptional activator FtrA